MEQVNMQASALRYVWPHPMHFVDDGLQASTLTCGKKFVGLQDTLNRVTGGTFFASTTEVCTTRLGTNCIMLQAKAGNTVVIPLGLTDVLSRALPANTSNADYAVVLAPRACRERVPEDSSVSQVWVLCFAGRDLDLSHFLFDLGCRGAVRWDIEECLSISEIAIRQGSSANVFIAEHLMASGTADQAKNDFHASYMAMKVLKGKDAGNSHDGIYNEISLMSKAQGHPNIAVLYSSFCSEKEDKKNKSADGLWWGIVMPLYISGDLYNYVQMSPLSIDAASLLLVCLFSALAHLHELRIVHRDVKPQNILLDGRMQPILADLGSAASLDDAELMAERLSLAAYCTTPEMLSGRGINEKVDIFSGGCVLYFASAGIHPFDASARPRASLVTIACKLKYPKKLFAKASGSFIVLLKAVLSKDPQNRPSAYQCVLARSMTIKPDRYSLEAWKMIVDACSALSSSLHSR
eukprot:TRINITY_DN3337_c0_g1_i5.p1 TRINITY_DN3337_c0_g1~~TRINITY_DN3337_c0_g1_i5.p1  ORF type:complete len:465 (+),score=73.39 TRINITY_DN3337_c0_g1_i5:35-1429(+)